MNILYYLLFDLIFQFKFLLDLGINFLEYKNILSLNWQLFNIKSFMKYWDISRNTMVLF